MATAPKTGASFFAETETEQSALQKYQEQRKRLQDLLEEREGRMFDPVLLAMGQGFLAPTKTGSFGESLGNVASMVGPAQSAEEKRRLEMAQIRSEIALQDFMAAQAAETGRQVANQPSIFDVMQGRAGPLTAPAAQAASQPAAQPAAPAVRPEVRPAAPRPPEAARSEPAVARTLSVSPQAAPTATGIPVPDQQTPSQRVLSVIERQLRSPRPEIQRMGENNLKLWEAQTKGIKVEGGNVYDLNNLDPKGRPTILYSFGKQEPFEITVNGEGKTVDMTPMEYLQYRELQAAGKESEGFKRFVEGRRSSAEKLPAYGGERAMFSIRVPDPSNPSRLMTLTGEGSARDRATLEMLNEQAFKSGNFGPLLERYRQVTGTSAAEARQQQAAPQQSIPAIGQQDKPTRRQLPPGQLDPELASLPLADQIKITTDRFKASDKVAGEQMDVIRSVGNPQNLTMSDNNLKEIIEITKRSPEAFGLLVKQGLIPAILRASQEGLRVGQYTISAPVNEFLKALKLPPDKQDDARRLTQLVDQEFFATAPLVKGALGPAISNADAQFMKSPQARPEDSARIISFWAANRLLANRQLKDVFEAANAYPAGMSPRGFIGDELPAIMNSYVPLFERLRKSFPISAGGRQ